MPEISALPLKSCSTLPSTFAACLYLCVGPIKAADANAVCCAPLAAAGQERDMGTQLHSAVRRAAVETEMETQLR